MQKRASPYLLGLLCLIPLIGFFIGVALIFYGIFKYKDRLLVIIGAAGIIFTVLAYSFLFYNLRYGKNTASGFAGLSQRYINSLINSIELYKAQNGCYPDSLEQISKKDEMVLIKDPVLIRKMNNEADNNFRYEKVGNRYRVFSVGIDGIANTADDIYPFVSAGDSSKYQFIRKDELR